MSLILLPVHRNHNIDKAKYNNEYFFLSPKHSFSNILLIFSMFEI